MKQAIKRIIGLLVSTRFHALAWYDDSREEAHLVVACWSLACMTSSHLHNIAG